MQQFSLFAAGPKGPNVESIKIWIDENKMQLTDWWKFYAPDEVFGLDILISVNLGMFDSIAASKAYSAYANTANI
jgi:hypothetical protein